MDYSLKFYLALVPLVLLNFSLVIWSVIDWSKRKKFKLLKKNVWLILIFFVQFIGPAFYLIAGRDVDND
jgi:4-hydroxybenzoate polyprenyltransferase